MGLKQSPKATATTFKIGVQNTYFIANKMETWLLLIIGAQKHTTPAPTRPNAAKWK